MKTIKYILFSLLIAVSYTVKAEDSIVNRNITVEREYKPVIQDAGKIKSTPKVLEPKVEKISPTYSNFNLPLNADYNIHALSAAELQAEKRKETSGGFARLGLGNYFNTMADFSYPLIKSSDTRLDISVNHLGTFGTKAHSTSKASLALDKHCDYFDLYGGLGEGHEYLKYYGNDFINGIQVINLDSLANTNPTAAYLEQDLPNTNRAPKTPTLKELANDSVSNTVWRFHAFTGIRSLPMEKGIRYKAEINFKSFESRSGLIESLVHTKAGFDTQNGENRIGLDLEMHNLVYKSRHAALLYFEDAYSIFSLNPFYSIEKKNFNIRLGVKSSFSFEHGRSFNPSTDIHTEWKAIPKYLSIYGGITGNYSINTMDEIFSENRYLLDDAQVDNTYTPFEFYAGLKVKPISNLLIDTYIDYRKIDNQYFFVNKKYKSITSDSIMYTNRFNVLYSGASLTKIGIRANYNLRNIINIEFKGSYNGWEVTSERYAWNKPAWQANLNTDFKINHDLTISANAFYESERLAKLGTMAVP